MGVNATNSPKETFSTTKHPSYNVIICTLYSALYKWPKGHTSPGSSTAANASTLSAFARVSQFFSGRFVPVGLIRSIRSTIFCPQAQVALSSHPIKPLLPRLAVLEHISPAQDETVALRRQMMIMCCVSMDQLCRSGIISAP